MSEAEGWLSRMTPEAKVEFLALVQQFIGTHRELSEQSSLAGLEQDFLGAPEPLTVAEYFTAHAVHADTVADLQRQVGELAAQMADVLRREFG
jgi:hypothetical protein